MSDIMKARIMSVMRNLPPLPQVTTQLLAVINDNDSSADDVTKVLSADGPLAGKVLKLVNSSFYGVAQEVTTVSRAVVLLGFTGIRNLALGFGTVDALKKMKCNMDMTRFWSHSIAVASAGQAVAPFVTRRIDPEEAFIAGLMHDIGAYILASAVPETYQEILDAPADERLLLEQEKFGMDHTLAGQALLKFWKLPDSLSEACRFHHDISAASTTESGLTTLTAIADILACVNRGDFETSATENDLMRLLEHAGLSTDDMTRALDSMNEKVDEMADFMKITGAGAADMKTEQGPARNCVVITTDDQRRELIQALLTHMGHSLFPMDAFFNRQPGSQDVDTVLVDPETLTRDQLDRLAVFLNDLGVHRAVLVERGTTVPAAMQDWPTLGFLFSSRQLAGVRDLTKA